MAPSRGAVLALPISDPKDKCLMMWVVLNTDEEYGCTSCTWTWFIVKLFPGAIWKLPPTYKFPKYRYTSLVIFCLIF